VGRGLTPPACLTLRPARFAFHAEAQATNPYVRTPGDDAETVARRAREEADGLTDALVRAGVAVLVLDERKKPGEPCPDAVFPNNWCSAHTIDGAGVLVLYPMRDPLRRRERWPDLRGRLEDAGLRIDRVIDLTRHEQDGRFLEGTGSLVFDDLRSVAYAARSGRTDEALARELVGALGYELVPFDARDAAGGPIYHTNVVMSVAPELAIACLARMGDGADRVRALLDVPGRTLVDIAPEQMDAFAANALVLPTTAAGRVLALSATAHASLTRDQRDAIRARAALLPIPIPTIEHVGGGSVRCMIATLDLPRV
jgi:hypothetical protein